MPLFFAYSEEQDSIVCNENAVTQKDHMAEASLALRQNIGITQYNAY